MSSPRGPETILTVEIEVYSLKKDSGVCLFHEKPFCYLRIFFGLSSSEYYTAKELLEFQQEEQCSYLWSPRKLVQ